MSEIVYFAIAFFLFMALPSSTGLQQVPSAKTLLYYKLYLIHLKVIKKNLNFQNLIGESLRQARAVESLPGPQVMPFYNGTMPLGRTVIQAYPYLYTSLG